MHTTDTYPRIAVSKDGDALISEGPAMPALFISRQKLKSFLDSPETTTIAEIGGVGAAAISACLEAQARFEALTESPLKVLLTFGNGLRVLYSEDGSGIDRPTGSGASSIDIIVTPRGAHLTGAKAVSRLDLRSLPSPPARGSLFGPFERRCRRPSDAFVGSSATEFPEIDSPVPRRTWVRHETFKVAIHGPVVP